MPRRILGVLALGAIALLTTTTAIAQRADACSANECTFEIPRMPLHEAIDQVSHVTGWSIGFSKCVANVEILTGPLVGRFSPEAALDDLLSPLGLSFQKVNERTVYVFATAAPTCHNVAAQPRASTATTDESARQSHALRMEEIVVDGSPIALGTHLHPEQTTKIVPYHTLTLTREKIEASGATTLSDVLKQLPQQPFVQPSGARVNGAQYVELRGLGPGTTLVLINGRRIVQSATDPTVATFDLNTIPLALIERIDVSTQPSVPHGMDAIGGIVNIVLTKATREPRFDVSYGASRGGGRDRQISMAAAVGNDLFGLSTGLAYLDREALLGRYRERWRDQDYRRFAGTDSRAWTSHPGNVRSLTGDNLPGLTTSFAGIPEHVTDRAARIEDFQLTAGQSNLESPLSFASIVPASEHLSAFANAELRLPRDWRAFVETFSSKRKTITFFPPTSLSGMPVSPANPHNPFGATVIIDRSLTDLPPPRQETDTGLVHAITGIEGRARGWDLKFAVLASQEHGQMHFENNIDLARAFEALNTSDPQQALNVFTAGPIASPEVLAALRNDVALAWNRSAVRLVELSASGKVMQLPTGDMGGTFGAQLRAEEIEVHDYVWFDARRRVSTIFGGLQIPLRKPKQLPGLRELTLDVAARLDNYGDGLGRQFNPQVTVTWRPADNWTVDTAHSRGFRPPSLMDLHSPRSQAAYAVADPRRQNQVTPVTVVLGGNSALQATTAHSSTIGITFAPPEPDALRVGINYWHLRMNDRIQRFSPQTLVANEEHYAERVVREIPIDEVIAGPPGRLRLLDISPGNIGSIEMHGIDLHTSQRWQTTLGQLTPQFRASWIDDLQTTDYSSTTPTQRVGVASLQGTITKWLAVASLDWQRGPLYLSGTARYGSSYDDVDGNGPTGRTVPAQVLFDAQASIRLGSLLGAQPLTQGPTISVGVVNLLDRAPPYSEVRMTQGYDPSQGDLRGRFWYLRLSTGF